MSDKELTIQVVKSYLTALNTEIVSPESLQLLMKSTYETIQSLPPSI